MINPIYAINKNENKIDYESELDKVFTTEVQLAISIASLSLEVNRFCCFRIALYIICYWKKE